MNAHAPLNTTATDLANAIQGKPRQDVFICRATFGGRLSPEYIVLVGGEYYEVHKYALGALQSGMTPEELELTPCGPNGSDAEDDYCHADNWHARYQRSKEGL